MIPPFPSPPRPELTSFILFTTLISPTADRTTELFIVSASFSNARDVERFTTKISFFLVSFKYPSAAKTREYSSPSGIPFSLTTASRSASGSTAKPASALWLVTAWHRSDKFSGSGSVPRLKCPSGSQFSSITSQPNDSSMAGSA